MSGINRAGRGHLLSDLQRLFDGELLLAVNLVPEGVAFNERGDEVQEAVCLTGVMQRQDVRMLQIRSRLYLSEEALGKLASFPPELLSRDQVSVRLLAARRRMLGLRIPAVVQNALYRGGDPMYGWRIGSQVSVTAMLALLVVAALPSGPRLPEPPGPLWQKALRPHRNATPSRSATMRTVPVSTNLPGHSWIRWCRLHQESMLA